MAPSISLRKLVCAAIVTCTSLLLCETIEVCPECAYEVTGGGNFCTHCGAGLKTKEKNDKDNPPQTVAATTESKNVEVNPRDRIMATCIEQDRRTAEAFISQNNVAGSAAALAALVNAKALVAISGEAVVSEDERKTIFGGILITRAAITKTLDVCPECKGKGKEDQKREFSSLDGKITVMKTGEILCRRCQGKGRVACLRSSGEMRRILSDGRRKFADQALLAGRTKLGNAWIPRDLAETLSNKEEATLRHFTADQCPLCSGYGKIGCDACGSMGIVKCTATGCVDGLVRPQDPSAGKNKVQRISTLSNTLPEPCTACNGRGYVTCDDCAGTGAISCTVCKGSGERKACAKCLGEGTTLCRACKGTGKDKKGNECRLCEGEGVVLCPTCGGDGYGRQ